MDKARLQASTGHRRSRAAFLQGRITASCFGTKRVTAVSPLVCLFAYRATVHHAFNPRTQQTPWDAGTTAGLPPFSGAVASSAIRWCHWPGRSRVGPPNTRSPISTFSCFARISLSRHTSEAVSRTAAHRRPLSLFVPRPFAKRKLSSRRTRRMLSTEKLPSLPKGTLIRLRPVAPLPVRGRAYTYNHISVLSSKSCTCSCSSHAVPARAPRREPTGDCSPRRSTMMHLFQRADGRKTDGSE